MTAGAARSAMTVSLRAAPLVADGSRVAPRSVLVSFSAGVVGLLSYVCTLLMAHVLGPREYSDYAAGQMLLGIVGIAAADRGAVAVSALALFAISPVWGWMQGELRFVLR